MMTEGNRSQQIASAVAAIKPDFRDIDPAAIAALITGAEGPGKRVTITDVKGGGANAGASSGVVVFKASINDVEGSYVLRYAPMNREGRIFVEYCIPEQFALQRKLANAGLPVPLARWLDADGATLGLPGFIMDKVEGDVAHAAPFQAGLIGDAAPDIREARIRSIMQSLDRLHKADWRALELESAVRRSGGGTPVERYLGWFWKTVEWTMPQARDRLEAVRRRILAKEPEAHPEDLCLIHGDPALGNYMMEGTAVNAVIDWELAGILTPSYDIAMQCLANYYYRTLSEADVVARIPTDAEWIAAFEGISGRQVKHFAYYRGVAACVLLIVQLSMARNFSGQARADFLRSLEPIWLVAETA